MKIKKEAHRIAAAIAASVLVACSGSDSTPFGEAGLDVPEASEVQAEPIRAEMSVENGDLVIQVQNGSAYDAVVLPEVSVDSPTIHASTELGEISVPAGERRREVITRDKIEGFDIAGSDWLRAELRYQVVLGNGDTRRLFTALAARNGAVVPKAQAIEQSLQLADMVLEGDPLVDKAVGDPFRVCFTNPLTFTSDSGVPSDGLTPNLSADSGSWPFRGQVVYAYYPATGTSMTVKELDVSGCVNLNRKSSGSSESWRFRILAYGGTTTVGLNAVAYAVNAAGTTPTVDKTVTISSSTPSIVSVEFPSGEARNLYTATFLAVNSLRQVTSRFGLSPPNGNILRLSPTTDTANPNSSFYCRAVSTPRCPTALTMRIGNGDYNSRATIAHETGHHIHRWYSTAVGNSDYTRADSGLPADTCDGRRVAGSHTLNSIEWQSMAHTEGLAQFFRAVTYNRTNQTDCSFESFGTNVNCEALGQSIRGNGSTTMCGEWTSSAFIGRTGNELDWAKMYWDFVTDYTGTNFAQYMEAERNVSASLTPTGNHFDALRNELTRLNATQGANFRDSAWGNILDGAAR